MAIARDRNFPVSLDGVPMIVPFRTAVGAVMLVGCSLMSACAHTVLPSTPKRPADMTSTDTYRVNALSEHPDLTPEEVGRRILRLLDGLGSIDELTTQEVVARTGIPLKYAPKGKVYAFTIQMPESPWYYGVIYRDESEIKSVELEYAYDGDAMPDGPPLCAMSVDDLAKRFKKDGFAMRFDVDGLGQALAYYFERSPLKVRVVPGASITSNETGTYKMCVSQLMITGVE